MTIDALSGYSSKFNAPGCSTKYMFLFHQSRRNKPWIATALADIYAETGFPGRKDREKLVTSSKT